MGALDVLRPGRTVEGLAGLVQVLRDRRIVPWLLLGRRTIRSRRQVEMVREE